MTDVLHTPEQAPDGEVKPSIPFSTTEALFLSAAIHGYVYRRHDELAEDKRDALLLVAIHARKAADAAKVFSLGYDPEHAHEMTELAVISRSHAILAEEQRLTDSSRIDAESLLAPSLGEEIANRFLLVAQTLSTSE